MNPVLRIKPDPELENVNMSMDFEEPEQTPVTILANCNIMKVLPLFLVVRGVIEGRIGFVWQRIAFSKFM